ncbi:unnamed protein product [Paramecium sonneborni]|uniref:Transmembrane protein n=1 Tax=Paramecium sonneborni TaxID=65129 RepID=A0A8S1P6X1_9CILI|nr:unnamed protein product [Paramecium sonneborni]
MEENLLNIDGPLNKSEINLIDQSKLSIDQTKEQTIKALSITNSEEPKNDCDFCFNGKNFCFGRFILLACCFVVLLSAFLLCYRDPFKTSNFPSIFLLILDAICFILIFRFSWHYTKKQKNIQRERLLPD